MSGNVAVEEIHASRLELVPLGVGHAGEMVGVLGDPALHAFVGGVPESLEELRARYARWEAGAPEPGTDWCNWVLRRRADGRLVGTVQATVVGDTAEVAWVVGTAWQGRGYASEAAGALVGWLRERVRTVVAHVHPGHAASAAVARAAGLVPTAEVQDGEVRWVAPASRRVRVACVHCGQDWLRAHRDGKSGEVFFLCPGCESLWTAGQDTRAATELHLTAFLESRGTSRERVTEEG
ncbi:GNAT family N-acetyltransferase [Streptomyces hydrogenans]